MTNKKAPSIRFKGFTDDWEQRKLDTITDVRDGTHDSPQYVETGHPFITSKNVKDGFINYEDIQYVSDKDYEEINKRSKVDKNDILMGMIGTIGNIALVRETPDFAIKNVALIKDIGDVYYRYLYHCLQSNSVAHQLDDNLDGGTQKFIALNKIRELVIPVPSEHEQHKIGDYMESLDNLITLHQRKHKKLLSVKKSMLEKMFPQNGAKVPEIRFEGFTDDWEQRKLDDLCSLVTKQTGFDYSSTIKPSLVNEHLEGTLPFIQNKDFSGNNINMDTDFYIPEEVVNKYPKITLDQPCLLISISGKIGNVGLYKRSERAFIGGAVGICRLLDDTNGEFIMQELLSDKGQHYFQSLIKASSHQNITVEDIRKIEIPMPSASEQKKISQYFEQLDNLITLHQSKLEKLRLIKKSMLDQMFV